MIWKLRFFVASFILALVLPICGISQQQNRPKVSESEMKQVVSHILHWYFKASDRQRRIYVANQVVRQSWLPVIRNTKFVLISRSNISRHKNGVYFFRRPERNGIMFKIDFGLGNPNCRAFGDTWYFHFRKGIMRLLGDRGNWGSDCDSVAQRQLSLFDRTP